MINKYSFINLVLCAGLLWLMYSLWLNADDGYRKINRLETRLQKFQAEMSALQMENKAIKARLADSRENADFIERQARELLFMIKPGEIFIQPVGEE